VQNHQQPITHSVAREDNDDTDAIVREWSLV
jgi:hypothetical protein